MFILSWTETCPPGMRDFFGNVAMSFLAFAATSLSVILSIPKHLEDLLI